MPNIHAYRIVPASLQNTYAIAIFQIMSHLLFLFNYPVGCFILPENCYFIILFKTCSKRETVLCIAWTRRVKNGRDAVSGAHLG